MNKHRQVMCENSIHFTQNLFKIYLEDGNIALLSSQFHEDISWFCSESHKIYRTIKEVGAFLENELKCRTNNFRIKEQWYDALPVNNEFCIVLGELKVIINDSTADHSGINYKFSMVCCCASEEVIKLYHAHFNESNIMQTKDENIQKLEECTNILKKTKETLRIIEKQYEITMRFSDMSMFEYNVITKELILFEKDAEMYGIPRVLHDGFKSLVHKGIITIDNASNIRKMYQAIQNGAPFAECQIYTTDKEGMVHEYELNLTAVFDDSGKAIRAIGIRKNITHLHQLQKEKEYGSTMVSDKLFAYEANVSKDKILTYNQSWAKKFGVSHITSLSSLTKFMSEHIISLKYGAMVSQTLSKEAIISAYADGQQLITIEYSKKIDSGEYRWFRKNINIIKEQNTGDINIRCYIEDINDWKEKEKKAFEEQKLYETMMSKSLSVYSINLTKNIVLSTRSKWGESIGIKQNDNYSEMIERLKKSVIHPDDQSVFYNTLSGTNLLNAYTNGNEVLKCEYRRPHNDSFIWVLTTAHLFEEPQSGDLKAFFYVENINKRKLKELDIIYKSEHDLLTGFYNKMSTEKYVNEFFSTVDGRLSKHAFFIIDADYFKSINDHLGHAFGDAVLKQVATKIKDLFRDIDILGRIGGDEFVVLMKNIQSSGRALRKAQEICDSISDSFTKYDKSYSLSASIGIAFYSTHGTTYSELYNNSDKALYVSKENGRNQFHVYCSSMSDIPTDSKKVDIYEFPEVKAFHENIIEYVFHILYTSKDKTIAINSVLELIGKHYNMSHSYIAERLTESCFLTSTYNWLNKDIPLHATSLPDISDNPLNNYSCYFNSEGIFLVADIEKSPTPLKAVFEKQGIKSTLQFSIEKDNEFKGFIGFNKCRVYNPTQKEILELKTISNILGVFIMEMRSDKEKLAAKNVAISIVNSMNTTAYVCNPKNHEIILANNKLLDIAPNTKIGSHCYESIWNRSSPCEDCPMDPLKPPINPTGRVTAVWIPWFEGEKMCLLTGK